MEALDKLIARQGMRLDPDKVFKKTIVTTFDDVKRVIAEFDPRKNVPQKALPLSTLMGVTEDNKRVTYQVSATTKSKSRRDILLEGLDIIKARLAVVDTIANDQGAVDVNGVTMKPALLGFSIDGSSWVDPLIRQWFGGYRKDLSICWDLDDGYTYKYNVYDHKLTRVKR